MSLGRLDRASLDPSEIIADLVAYARDRGFGSHVPCPMCEWDGVDGHRDCCPIGRAERLESQ